MTALHRTAAHLAALEAEHSAARFAGDPFSQAIARFARINRERAERALEAAAERPELESLELFTEED